MADTQDESPESGNAQIIAPLADRLPELLPAETKFLEMLSGGAYATDAYEKAFPKRCAGKSRQYIGQLACAMRMKPNIRLWIAAITEAGMLRAVTNREEHSAELRRLRERAVATSQMAAAVTAEFNLGKVAGLYWPESIARERDGLGDTGFAARIAIEMPELAAGLARLLPAPRTERPVPPGEKPGDDR